MGRSARTHLTDMGVKNLRPPPTGQTVYWDAHSPVGVRVSAGGAKSFIIMVGSGRRETIGSYPALSLSEARADAKKRIAERTLGLRHVAPTVTFSEALAGFLAQCEERNKPGTAKETRRLLNRHFLPEFRSTLVADITDAAIGKCLDRLSKTPGEQRHAFTAARTFFRWCTRPPRRYLKHSPMEGYEAPSKARSRERVLSDRELTIIYRSAGELGWPFGTIVQLLILTGQRRNEITSLRETWVDGSDIKSITLPSEIVKNSQEHTIPLCPMAEAILERTPILNGMYFKARGADDRSYTGWSKGKRALDKLIKDEAEKSPVAHWTLHDLRRTFSTGLARLGVPQHINDKLLNHRVSSQRDVSPVAMIYNRYEYWEEQNDALSKWEARISDLLRAASTAAAELDAVG